MKMLNLCASMHIPLSSVSMSNSMMDDGAAYIDKMCRPNLHLNILLSEVLWHAKRIAENININSRYVARNETESSRAHCTNEEKRIENKVKFSENKGFPYCFVHVRSLSLFSLGVLG